MREPIRTKIVFGAGTHAKVGKEAIKYGKRVLIVHRKSIPADKQGWLVGAIEAYGAKVGGFFSIPSNPTVNDLAKSIYGFEIRIPADEYNCIVAIGGGGVLDAAKILSMMIANSCGPMMFFDGNKPEKALPIIAVPTMAASGSETNAGYVLTVDGVKRGSSAWAAIPKVAILDPELTLSVPKDLASYGLIDAYSHVLEGYLHGEKKSPVADAMAEAVMERINNVAERLWDEPADLEARGEAMLLSNVANDGSLNVGRGQVEWKIHEKAHQRADLYHGKAVALAMLEYFKDSNPLEPLKGWFRRIGVES